MSNIQEYLIDVANLITLPDIYIAVKEVVEDPDTSMAELAGIVSFDPAISTKLLRIAIVLLMDKYQKLTQLIEPFPY